MSTRLNMDDILQASLGEVSNEINVTFKKTILIRDYETEVIEATNRVIFDGKLSGMERMFVSAIIEAQLEYMTYTNLALKGLIAKHTFEERKSQLEEEISLIKIKADSLLGEGVIDKYIKFSNLS